MTTTPSTPSSLTPSPDLPARYLSLVKRALTRDLHFDEEVVDVVHWPDGRMFAPPDEMWAELYDLGLRLVRNNDDSPNRHEGRDYYPPHAESMIGTLRLDNLEAVAIDVLTRGVPGDFVETGVWRGGAAILMRAVLAAYGITDRKVWACDSFAGLPEPDGDRYPADVRMKASDSDGISNTMMSWLMGVLAVPRVQVEANFARYALLDDQVEFLEGWFRDTLPDAPIGPIALLRLDGDLYESTILALENLEPKVSPGGCIIVDDYKSIPACREAVDHYRAGAGIDGAMDEIDWTGVWWQKPA